MAYRHRIALLIISGLALSFAHGAELDVTLTGGFAATVSPAVTTGEKRQAFTYSVRGASVLEADSGSKYRLSIDCVGYDEVGEGAETQGTGRCTWSDADGHSLYVIVETIGDGNRYTCTGGSGKWVGAGCEITTTFTYLPSPDEALFLGTDEGVGTLSVADSEEQ